jgi:hypothetical protein
MIGGIPRYANLSARVRTMVGYLIRGDQWHTLGTPFAQQPGA